MTEENKKQEEINKKMRKQFTNALINSTLDKKIVGEILGNAETTDVFFTVYLLGCKDMYANIAAIGKSKDNQEKGDE